MHPMGELLRTVLVKYCILMQCLVNGKTLIVTESLLMPMVIMPYVKLVNKELNRYSNLSYESLYLVNKEILNLDQYNALNNCLHQLSLKLPSFLCLSKQRIANLKF